MKISDHGDLGDSADDDGSELIRTLSRLVPFSDDVPSESEESSDEDLETVSEKRYHNDGKAASTYLAAAKNLPEKESVEEVSYHPSYLSKFEKEHFHRENIMPDRPYTAFFFGSLYSFRYKGHFSHLVI